MTLRAGSSMAERFPLKELVGGSTPLRLTKQSMALEYMKVTPEDAILTLEECLVTGYQLKDALEKEYADARSSEQGASKENLTKWHHDLNDWTNTSLKKLSEVFKTPRQQYNFRDAKASAVHRIGVNMDFDNIVNHLQARIDVLNGYIEFIFQHGQITIIAGRDVQIQKGEGNKMEVKN